MLRSTCLLVVLAVVTYCVDAAPSWDSSADEFSLRGAPKGSSKEDAAYYYRRSRARGKGIGSLLLKNLRFRDLSDLEKGDGLSELLNEYPGVGLSHGEAVHGVDKRQSINVSQLARLLNNLKARNVDEDGVKLQSLRFGRK